MLFSSKALNTGSRKKKKTSSSAHKSHREKKEKSYYADLKITHHDNHLIMIFIVELSPFLKRKPNEEKTIMKNVIKSRLSRVAEELCFLLAHQQTKKKSEKLTHIKSS
jgi:hypothetical protein